MKAAASRAGRKQPRDAGATRQRNRCSITEAAHAACIANSGLARNVLREAANRGEIPGLSKASW